MRGVLAAVVLLVASAAVHAGEGDGEATSLRYRVQPGQVFAHALSVKVNVRVVGMAQNEVPEKLKHGLGTSVGGRVTTVVAAEREDGSYDMLQAADLQAGTPNGGRTRRTIGPLPFILTSNGAQSGQLAGSSGAMQIVPSLGASGASAFGTLPVQSLQPGDTWQETARTDAGTGVPVEVRIIHRFLGVQTVDGERCARVEMQIAIPQTMVPARQGVQAEIRGGGRGTAYLSLATGIARRQEAKMALTMRMAKPGRPQATMASDIVISLRQVKPSLDEMALGLHAVGKVPPTTLGKVVPAPVPVPREAPASSVLTVERAHPDDSVSLLRPYTGEQVRGDFVARASVPEGSSAAFAVFYLNDQPVAAVNKAPFTCQVPVKDLTPGQHTVAVEVYGAPHSSPLARQSVPIRVAQ